MTFEPIFYLLNCCPTQGLEHLPCASVRLGVRLPGVPRVRGDVQLLAAAGQELLLGVRRPHPAPRGRQRAAQVAVVRQGQAPFFSFSHFSSLVIH